LDTIPGLVGVGVEIPFVDVVVVTVLVGSTPIIETQT
jgi:hypothetical protein